MRNRTVHVLSTIVLSVVALGVAHIPRGVATTASIRNAHAVVVQQGQPKSKPYEVGKASWYGSDFDGKPTASGEPYDMYDFTAAHPSLPLGSTVRVTNLRNGKAVLVKVNDRGPYVAGRIIDLSYSAARALDFKDKGIQRVRLDLVRSAS